MWWTREAERRPAEDPGVWVTEARERGPDLGLHGPGQSDGGKETGKEQTEDQGDG